MSREATGSDHINTGRKVHRHPWLESTYTTHHARARRQAHTQRNPSHHTPHTTRHIASHLTPGHIRSHQTWQTWSSSEEKRSDAREDRNKMIRTNWKIKRTTTIPAANAERERGVGGQAE